MNCGKIEIECGKERLYAPRKKRLNSAKFGERLNARELEIENRINALISAVLSAEACLRLFETEGQFRVNAPAYVDGEEFAHNVRIAHVHAARQAREVLAEALKTA